ncbi:MAG: nucleoside kinase [Alphaproteobacteria bacterium]|nr:nucleoside kinase [Alphaproteobacteria bacterium]MBL6936329.1 nucleoside kinase [Alphaproteobacteria bacterium]MBL7098620.1 nucleoside kinase [Alphaproteobacteria bacterium]
MGVRNYLIDGVSGAGKTSVAEELERRGYHVIHGDRSLAYMGDPETGESLSGPPQGVTDRLWWEYERWIWPVDKVKALIADQTAARTFFCGGSRNFHHYIDLFDKVFVLNADLATLNRRVSPRAEDEFGGKPEEWALIVRVHATKVGIPKGVGINAMAPIERVVDAILEKTR